MVSLFGVAASLITASYLTFERNQRVKNAALQLKSDLRLIQNKTTSGDKGAGSEDCSDVAICCPASDSTLGGWYLRVAKEGTSYSYGGICAVDVAVNNWANEVIFSPKTTVNLPNDTKIRKIFHSLSPDVTQAVAVLFRPLRSGVEYFVADLVLSSQVDFFDDVTGVSKTGSYIIPTPTGVVSVELSNLAGNKCYLAKLEPSGEVIDEKPISCSI